MRIRLMKSIRKGSQGYQLHAPWKTDKKLVEPGWFMDHPRPNDDRFFFGKVQAIFEHQGPDRVTRIFVQCSMHDSSPFNLGSSNLYEPEIRAPLFQMCSEDLMDIVDAKNVVPWICWPEDCPSKRYQGRAKRLMLAKHWHILRSFLSVPQIPSTQEMPDWLVTSSINNQAAVDNEKMKRAQKAKEEKKIAAKKKRDESKAKQNEGYEDRSGRREVRKTKG